FDNLVDRLGDIAAQVNRKKPAQQPAQGEGGQRDDEGLVLGQPGTGVGKLQNDPANGPDLGSRDDVIQGQVVRWNVVLQAHGHCQPGGLGESLDMGFFRHGPGQVPLLNQAGAGVN